MEHPSFDQFFVDAPSELDLEAIRQEWLALRPPYQIADRHLPLPVWARRPFTESGEEAWQILRQDVPIIDATQAYCIYIHVPFCASRCSFCDCYSFRLASHRERHIHGYLDLLTREMDLWGRLGTLTRRAVSTVHFGGGTPTYLGLWAFSHLVSRCRERFAVDAATEWALESTATELSPEMLACLNELGFTRLHVGVQTLRGSIRQALGRRAKASTVLSTIAQAIESGWVVSVDLIYGLPGQTLRDLLDDIRSLVSVGVNGFSLYELQLSSRNRGFARQHGLDNRDRQLNYWFCQAAAHFLDAQGYEKTLFNHYADDRDTNLYFTFPARGEDCLALGTIADGYFGDYHYRHPEYAAYIDGLSDGFPVLQGGLRRNEIENHLQPLSIALLGGSVDNSLFADPVGQALLHSWRDSLLLNKEPGSGKLRLTGNGSWFVGNMLSELLARHARA